MNRFPIKIHSIHIAPTHKVFGKSSEDVSGHDLESLTEANLIANSGIKGDRFCRPRPDYNGHVTFFSKEVWDEISETLKIPNSIGPETTRRNIIVSGIDLNKLYNASFEIQNIRFIGTGHCAPCLAMNRAFGAGARAAMRSRGGLRAQIKTNGFLNTGSCELFTDVHFDPKNASTQTHLTKIP